MIVCLFITYVLLSVIFLQFYIINLWGDKINKKNGNRRQ